MESALRQVPPPELKSVTWFITRAREMFSVDKVVTFYALLYAAENALAIGSQQDSSRQYISGLLKIIETLKSELENNELVTDPQKGRNHILELANKIFNAAEVDLQRGRTSKVLVSKFSAAASFFEICRQFPEGLGTEQNKIKYVKFCALKLGKAHTLGSDEAIQAAIREIRAAKGSEEEENDILKNLPSIEQFSTQAGISADDDIAPTKATLTASLSDEDKSSPISADKESAQLSAPLFRAPKIAPNISQQPGQVVMATGETDAFNEAKRIDFDKVAEARRFARWGLSALDFYDISSAEQQFEKTLSILKHMSR